MVIGVAVFELRIAGAFGLKDKRRVLSSLLNRLRSRFNVSASEIEHQDVKQHATIAVCVVANSTAHIHSVLSNVTNFVDSHQGLECIKVSTEIL
ncbi:DUF503 domain-containing protein [Metallumcola ferriviriculae]|uniref:DUF503 domain-containing protein n=1 Tax=Metallumcola ferriviriculae TaxID=3039180 RepID=A0AAU0URY7_9FIRM|nr:DUF503 domain-containing protein [Desulfitibacteraceae bacterium MK1]